MPSSNSKVSLQVTHHHGNTPETAVQNPQRKKNPSSEERAAMSIAVIIALFIISWLPLYTLNTIIFFHPNLDIPEFVFHGFIVLSHCNSAWNPVVYAWGTRDFRSAFRRMLYGRQSTHNSIEFQCSLQIGRENLSRTASEEGLRHCKTKHGLENHHVSWNPASQVHGREQDKKNDSF